MEDNAKHSEILFIWDARMCNPNGDMASDNAPRFDDVDEKAIVSDVRIKRTIRNDLQNRKNRLIFINNDDIMAKCLNAEGRFKEIKDQSKIKDQLDIFLTCIDNRLFGGVAPKSNIQLIGTVQFSWTKSLNKTEAVLKAGTGAFATKSKDGETKSSKTLRIDNYIPYAIFAMHGSINRLQAIKAKTTEHDINDMLDSLWVGTKCLNTRSKSGQKPRMLIKIEYKDNCKYFIGLLDELVSVKNKNSEMIREVDEADIDFSKLINAISRANKFIEKVKIVYDESLKKYIKQFSKLKNVEFIDDVDFCIKNANI